jgi:proteic killer suppression protein
MIKSFKDKESEKVFKREFSKKLPQDIQRTALRKLTILNAATSLDEMKVPPGNQLEALKDDRKGQHSIRINQQWRVCFVWRDGNVHDLEIVDYH